MFGEVFDTTRPFTSHFTTTDRAQAVLDFPFQAAAQSFAANSGSTDPLRDFFVADDWYTDADSNVYQLPTFLGNHGMGRIGHFIRAANGSADDDDEQGFTGDPGGDQNARQDMFKSQVARRPPARPADSRCPETGS